LLADFVRVLRADGHSISHVDLGGGLGIPYRDDNEPPPHPEAYAKVVKQATRDLDCRLIFEPGRLIVGNAGILVTRVLFVKLSSLGDVIHHFPAVSDLRAHRPDIGIDWAVEEAYAELVRLHPAVESAIAVSFRRLKASPLSASAWGMLSDTTRALRARSYDYIVDTQGLVKSAAAARLARGPVFGLDRSGARERAAARFYDVGIAVQKGLHAVERNRRLVGSVFGYVPTGAPDYGLGALPPPPEWAPHGDYVVALHASSRADKRWPAENWAALASRLAADGISMIYPGGSEREREDAARLAAASPAGMAAPPMSLTQAAALLAHARGVVGVDTGLTHLAVALGCTTVGLYVATEPGLTGLSGGAQAVNLGGPGRVPGVDDVVQVLFGNPPE
jgi:heptosyltransferase-1